MACGQWLGPRAVGPVEGGDADAEMVGMAADLVQRNQAVVAVEGGVLEALGHHRTAILLHLHGEAHDRLAAVAAAGLGDQVGDQQRVQEVEDAGIDVGLVAPRLGDRPVDVAPVGLGRRPVPSI